MTLPNKKKLTTHIRQLFYANHFYWKRFRYSMAVKCSNYFVYFNLNKINQIDYQISWEQ